MEEIFMTPQSSPKISFVLPVYNAAATLPCALDSMLGQSMREIEVVAVDDASSDNSREILKSRAADDPRLKVIFQEKNRGTLSARLRALQEVSGKYVLFLDPDDFFDLNSAAELYALAEKEQVDIIHFGTKEFARQPDGSRKVRYGWTTPENQFISGKGAVLHDLLTTPGQVWSLCFKMIRAEICRKAADDLEDFFCVMGEDLYFYLAAAYHAESLLQISRTYYNYDTTAGITAVRKVSDEKFRRTASLLDALGKGGEFLRSRKVLDDPAAAVGWKRLMRGQYLILWNQWYSRLEPGSRGAAAEYLMNRAPDKELLVLSLFDENEYLRENGEFLKFARGIYGIMNRLLPPKSFLRMKMKTWYKRWKLKSAGKEKS